MGDTLIQAIQDGRISLDQAKEQFRKPTMGERVEGAAKIGYRSGLSALLQGNAMLMELEGKALGAVGLDEVGKKFGLAAESMGKGKMMESTLAGIGEPAPQLQNDTALGKTVFQDMPMALGSMVGMASTPGPKGSKAGTMFRGALVGGAQGYWEARGAGADDAKSWASFAANAALGTTEAGIPFLDKVLPPTAQMRLGQILARADKASGGGLQKILWEGTKTGFSESVQEGLQQVGSNAIAQVLYDDDRKIVEGLLPTIRGSFLAGILTGGLAANGTATPSNTKVSGDQESEPIKSLRVNLDSLSKEEQDAVKNFGAGTGSRVQPVTVENNPVRDFVERRGARLVFVESEDGSPLSHPASYNKDGSIVVVDVNAGDALESLVDHEIGHHVLDNVEGARERIQQSLGPELQAQALEDYRRDLVAAKVKEAGRDLTEEEMAQIEQETMPHPDEGIARLAEDFSPVIRLMRTNPEAFSKVQDVGFWRGMLNAVLDVGRSMLGKPSSKERAVAQLYRSVARRGVASTVSPEEGVQIAKALTSFLDEAVGMQQKSVTEATQTDTTAEDVGARGDDTPPGAVFPNTGDVVPRGDDAAADPALGQFKDRLPSPSAEAQIPEAMDNPRGRELLSKSKAELESELESRLKAEDATLREQHPDRGNVWYDRVADLRRQARDPNNIEGDRAALQLKRAGIQPSGANVEEIADALRAKDVLARTPKGRFGAESKAQAQNVGMRPKYAVSRQTETPEFKAWFGDSKVVGEDGKPKVMYYVTKGKDFEVTPENNGLIWVVSDLERAMELSTPIAPGMSEVGRVVPVFVKIESPLSTDNPNITVKDLRYKKSDGVIHEFDGETIAMVPSTTQLKIAVGNSGEFGPGNPDIRRAVARTQSSMPREDDSRFSRIRAYVQNDLEQLRRVVENARSKGKVTDANDPYLAESLRNSRSRTRIQDDQQKYVEPVLKAVADSGINVDDAEMYLLARAAPARNAIVEIRTQGKNTSGSGMTDAQAIKITQAAMSGPNAAGYQAIADAFDKLTKRTREHWINYGLESKETVDNMEQQQPAYAPFRSEINSDDKPRGPGRQIKGREFKVALGRTSMAENPIAYAVEDLQRAIMRGETNKSRQTLYQFAKGVGDSGFAFVDVPPMKDALVNGQIRKVPDFQEAENEVTAKVGGKLRRVRFTDPYASIARSLKNADRESVPENVRRVIEPITKAPVAFSTRWNPLFPPVNFGKDILGAALNEQSFKIVSPSALKTSFREIRTKGPWYERFRRAGGPVAFMDLQRTTEQLAADLKAEVEKQTTGKDPRAWHKRTWAKYAEFVERNNDFAEAMTRLSGFKYAVEELNYSDAKAALFAKDLTTNFERRGQAAWINTLYAFSNANIQSMDKFARSMKKPGAKKLALALAGAAFAMSVMNRAIGGDDDDGIPFYDKIDPWTRQSNAIIMNPWSRGDYFKIPLPFMWGWFHVLGDQMATGAHTGDYAKSAEAIGNAANDMFNPLGASPSLSQTLAPTAVDPLVQMSENKTFTGSPLYPEKFGDKTRPDSELVWDNTNQYLVEITKWLNKSTGGTSTKSGAVDVSAISIEHLLRSYFGGTGGETSRAVETIRKVATGEDTTVNEWPLARRYLGEVALKDTRRVFLDHTRMIDQATKDEKAGNEYDQRLYRLRLRERAWKDRIGDLEDAVRASDSVTEREKLRQQIRSIMIDGVKAIKESQR